MIDVVYLDFGRELLVPPQYHVHYCSGCQKFNPCHNGSCTLMGGTDRMPMGNPGKCEGCM